MNKNDFSHGVTSIFQKAIVVLSGLILSLVLFEAGLRLGGFILTSMQAYENFRSVKQKGTYRILCLGESTTRGQYPQLLEQVLNQRHIGVRFSVIDEGKSGINTFFISGRVESYLAEYHPNMVVAMMGINDKYIKYYQDIGESRTWIFQHCRVYRFGRILYMHFLKKLQGKDIYGSDRTDWERKPMLGGEGTAIEKADLPSEVSVDDGMAGLDPKNDKENFGARGTSQHDDFFEPPRFPEKTSHYVRIGQLYWAQSKFSQAEDSFKKAIELNPENDNAYVALGQLYLRQGKLSQAEASFKKAIERNSKNDRAYAGFGEFYRLQDKSPQAENSYRKAIELNPKNDNAYVGLGRLYQNQGKFLQAEDFFRKAVELNPKNEDTYIRLGRLCKHQGKSQQAEDSFKKAIEFSPANTFYFLELAALYREQGKFSMAANVLQKANEFDPHDARVLVAMASLYEEMGKPELANGCAKKADQFGLEDQSAVTVNNYRNLKEILDRKGIKLVCMQYPMRNVEPLKKIFGKYEGVIFVDNESVFKEALKKSGYKYKEYFRDMFGGDFGHCTPKGNMLLAQNVADVILREVFNR